jgi:hypothetical protein
MNKKWHVVLMFFVVMALFLVSSILVVVGVVMHQEPGFMDDRPDWRRGQFPLVVCTNAPFDIDIMREAERNRDALIGSVNTEFGFPVLRRSRGTASDVCNITINYGVAADSPHGDSGTVLREPGGAAIINGTSCSVELVNPGNLVMDVLRHEVGHCLGLAHDDFDSSIMRPVQRFTPDGQFPATFTDHDVRLIREEFLGE